MKWDSMALTDEEGVRSCAVCRKDVYYCRSDEEAIEHAKVGHCVAIEMVPDEDKPTITIGRPIEPDPITPEQEVALARSHIDLEKMRSLSDLKYADRYCDTCGFPIASFRKYCWVCDRTSESEQGTASNP